MARDKNPPFPLALELLPRSLEGRSLVPPPPSFSRSLAARGSLPEDDSLRAVCSVEQ